MWPVALCSRVVRPSICPPGCLSVLVSVCPAVCQSGCPSVCPSGLHFFLEWEGEAGRGGGDKNQLKKIRQGGHMEWVLTNVYFKGGQMAGVKTNLNKKKGQGNFFLIPL